MKADEKSSIGKTLRLGALLALLMGILIRVFWLPIPITTTFSAFMFFIVLQIVEDRFGPGLGIAARLWKKLLTAAVAFAAFIVLVFLIGQVFSIYPGDAYDAFANNGGFHDVFWGHQAPRSIVLELVILLLVGYTLWGCLRRKWTGRFLTSVLALIIFIGVIFPAWAGSWPEKKDRLDKSLAERGLLNTIDVHFPSFSLGVEHDEELTSNATCDDAVGSETDLDYAVAGYNAVQVVHGPRNWKSCFWKVIHLPKEYGNNGWCYQPSPLPAEDETWSVRFQFGTVRSDGTFLAGETTRTYHWEEPLRSEDKPNFRYRPLTFRLELHAPAGTGIMFSPTGPNAVCKNQ